MWANMEKDTRRGKPKRKMAELFADERRSSSSSGLRTWAEGPGGEPGAEQSALGASASAGCAGGRDSHGSLSCV